MPAYFFANNLAGTLQPNAKNPIGKRAGMVPHRKKNLTTGHVAPSSPQTTPSKNNNWGAKKFYIKTIDSLSNHCHINSYQPTGKVDS
tara:strand:+ start:3290 stop:3550 length:261 start_codon:yes stop_codon:yes gene_type:complete